jgi:hypothetical protein
MRANGVLSVQQRETPPDDVENLVKHAFAGHLVGCGAALMDGQNRVLHAGLSGSCGPGVASLRRPPAAGTVTGRVDDRTPRRGRFRLDRENRLDLRLKMTLETFNYGHFSLLHLPGERCEPGSWGATLGWHPNVSSLHSFNLLTGSHS